MDSRGKLEFPSICRSLRIQHGLTQAKVADAIGVKHSSYGNVESANYVVIGQKKVEALARLYDLNENDTQQMINYWKLLPVHEYTSKNRERWKEKNAQRSKAKAHDALWRAAVEAFGIVAGIMFDEQWSPDKCASLCACDKSPGVHPPSANHPSLRCEFCTCLEVLGMPEGWTDLETVTAKLAEHQDKMDGVTGTEE